MNFVRSAMAPETIVAAVAAKTVWKMRNVNFQSLPTTPFSPNNEVPKKPFIRFLYFVRLASMGSYENRQFARDEVPELMEHFSDIRKSMSPTGKSKLLSGRKEQSKG